MLAYAIETTPDDNGTLLVTCPDLPEVTTWAEDESDAQLRARDAIEEALAARMADREAIPAPAPALGRAVAALPALAELKIALYSAMRETGTRKVDLARLLSAHGPQVDRLLDLRHASRLDQLETALAALNKRVVIRVL